MASVNCFVLIILNLRMWQLGNVRVGGGGGEDWYLRVKLSCRLDSRFICITFRNRVYDSDTLMYCFSDQCYLVT